MRRLMPKQTTPIHQHPDECVPLLGFRYCDGGRSDYFNKHKGTEVPADIQDCAVVAVSVATTFNPEVMSPALSYSGTLDSLWRYNRRVKPWERKGFREGWKDYIIRRLKEICAEMRKHGIPIHQDPKYGVNTNVLSPFLDARGFSFVFGEPLDPRPFCLCSDRGTYVIDGVFDNGGDHAFAVIDGNIVADYDFREVFGKFHVMHVWRRN